MPRQFYKVNIEISNICNLQCSFCPEVIRPKNLMSRELFRKVIDEVAPLTKLVTFHLMGEPLVHPQLGEFIEICHEKGVRIFFVTNGVLLREKESEWLLHPAIRQVSFSLHSFRDNFKEKDIEPYLDRIFKFTEEAFEKRPHLFINYRLWNLSHARAKEDANLDLLERIEKRFDVSINREIDVREKKSIPIKNKLSLHFDTEFIWPTLENPLLGESGTCQGMSSHFGILSDGRVVPCCLDKEGVVGLGDITQTPLLEILKSARAQALLEGFRKNRLVEDLCRRCQYIERFQPGPAIA